ncbi:acetolactate synthase small subunit [Clostridium sp. AM58-1XD]|nr:acetolactate synthase small subunit [Clostridium sp. AM58-1XD]RGY98063.1 acetolactate synthase small subunit [Clostridium sp. AM58-1XD]
MIKKRWICLFVENDIGVLARISSLFSGKSYNLDSLTVGRTEDRTISRMTIGLTSDDMTFEQVKKQLNRCIEVIKVVDFTDVSIHKKELMFIKISSCSRQDMNDIFQLSQVFNIRVADCSPSSAVVESVHTDEKNDKIAIVFSKYFSNRVEIVRGGSVAIEAVSADS